jgi:hypothetical protein
MQSGSSISGWVVMNDYQCDNSVTGWDVSGAIAGDGTFTIYAEDPAAPDACGVSSFSYSGTLSGIGCDSGSGTWQNDLIDPTTGEYGSGDWNWSAPCEGPDTEVTSYSTIGWNPSALTEYYWAANAVSYSGLTFTGRTVYESDAGGYVPIDTCYYPGSAVARNGPVPYNQAYINWNQGYSDLVGWTPFAVVWYRDNRPTLGLPMPCSFALYQNMNMKCSSGTADRYYKQNLLQGVIGLPTRVESWRDGNLAATTF